VIFAIDYFENSHGCEWAWDEMGMAVCENGNGNEVLSSEMMRWPGGNGMDWEQYMSFPHTS